MKLLLFGLLCLPLAGQTWVVGSISDPCTGGTPYQIQWVGFPVLPPVTSGIAVPSIGTLRYDPVQFTCTFPAAAGPGSYIVTLSFIEPGATASGQRLFNVSINDDPVLSSFDVYADGGTNVGVTITRSAVAFSPDGNITVKCTTLVRNAILSQVSVRQVFFQQASDPGFVIKANGLQVSLVGTWQCQITAPQDGQIVFLNQGSTLGVLWLPDGWCDQYGNISILAPLQIAGSCDPMAYTFQPNVTNSSNGSGTCSASPAYLAFSGQPFPILYPVVYVRQKRTEFGFAQ